MQVEYNLESDSDDEDNNKETSNKSKNVGNHIHDIEKLKAQTNELLDPTWKELRNKNLINKMLELEQPSISPKMVDFLLQDGVIETLVQFITQVDTGLPRPLPSDPRTEQLKLGYKAVVLLTPDEPNEALLSILSKKASIISKQIFDIFQDNSAGSFYHAYRILDTLLRCFPNDVYEGILADGNVTRRIESMLRYIGYAPVHDMFLVLIALTPLARNSQIYNSCALNRWSFLEQLREWSLLLRITEILVKPSDYCNTESYISAETHSTAAAQLMLDLIEKLSLEEIGEIFLRPLGHETIIIDLLITTAVDVTCDDNIRRSSSRLLCFLLRRAAEAEIVCIVNAQPGQQPQQTFIPNRLFPMRERIVLHIETRLNEIFKAVIQFKSNSDINSIETSTAIKYSGYQVDVPFTSLRATLVELIVLMVESDEAVATSMPVELWKELMSWSVKYAFNSIYHALFYRLIFSVLRQSQEQAQRIIFQKAKLASFLIDNYIPFPTNNADIPKKDADPLTIHRHAARGLLMNSLNAIRLQASCQPPTTFLRQFLASHQKWNEFLPILTNDTDIQQRFGMGITVTMTDNKPAHNVNSLSLLISEPKPEDGGIDHGSRFARSLGFYDETPYPNDHNSNDLDIQTRSKRKDSPSNSRQTSYDDFNIEEHAPWDFSYDDPEDTATYPVSSSPDDKFLLNKKSEDLDFTYHGKQYNNNHDVQHNDIPIEELYDDDDEDDEFDQLLVNNSNNDISANTTSTYDYNELDR